MENLLDIGEVITRSGFPASSLHYYERQGLIGATTRKGLRRQYPPDTIDRLAVIAICQRAGFNLEEIAQLLSIADKPAWKDLVRNKLADIRSRAALLAEIERGLEHALECPSENLMRCEHFRSELSAALPIEPDDRAKRPITSPPIAT